MSLAERIAELIRQEGPLTTPQYVQICLHDPADGYYAVRPRLGPQGDFITAPQVSQIFGELIGLWAVQVWIDLGAPARVILAEVGPGDGTLMSDALRAARVAAKFPAAVELWLVEPSGPLRRAQALALQRHAPRWATSLDELPDDAPLILIANEVLDCLPARQFVTTEGGWAERRIGLDDDGRLAFGLIPVEAPPAEGVPVGTIMEHSESQAAFAAALAAKVLAQDGCALLIDYGRAEAQAGDTLQAVRDHRKVHPLETPGEADLTQWAEFDVVTAAAEAASAGVSGPVSQAALLGALGLELRAQALAKARPDQAEVIARQVERLTGREQMGELFKAVAIHRSGMAPPGFTA